MSDSLRAFARESLGLDGDSLSVVRDILGYHHGLPRPADLDDPNWEDPVEVSLRTYMRQLRNATAPLKIDVIMVGTTGTPANRRLVAGAIHEARRILSRPRVAISRIDWHNTSGGQAGQDGWVTLDEATDLVRDVTKGSAKDLDVFFVKGLKGAAGLLPGREWWEVLHEDRADGIVVAIDASDQLWIGCTVAHELCHFFGLNHRKNPKNLMWSDKCGVKGEYGYGESLTAWQGGHIAGNIRRFNKSGDPEDVEVEGKDCL